MKVVILAGGLGTRLSEETALKPKPMVEIGGKPIIWHIMSYYSHFGYNEFIICAGYKGNVIKDFFANYALRTSDITFDIGSGDVLVHNRNNNSWKVTIVDTGENTLTGGRLLRVKDYIGDNTFMLTYGDGLSTVNLDKLLEVHIREKRTVTLTAVKPPLRFGILEINGDTDVTSFEEKPEGDGKYINGGYMVCEPSIFKYINGDDCALEKTPLNTLGKIHQIAAYKHDGFWYAMDTLREKQHLDSLWQSGNAPWKVW